MLGYEDEEDWGGHITPTAKTIAKPSELARKLAEALAEFVNRRDFEGICMNSPTLNSFIVGWLLDNNITLTGGK